MLSGSRPGAPTTDRLDLSILIHSTHTQNQKQELEELARHDRAEAEEWGGMRAEARLFFQTNLQEVRGARIGFWGWGVCVWVGGSIQIDPWGDVSIDPDRPLH